MKIVKYLLAFLLCASNASLGAFSGGSSGISGGTTSISGTNCTTVGAFLYSTGTVVECDTAIKRTGAGAQTATTFTGALVGNATTATDTASKTGTGSTYATSASPTFTGTVGAAAITASGNYTSATGNFNLGNGTPPAWTTSAVGIQLGYANFFADTTAAGAANTSFNQSVNAYWDNASWKYATTGGNVSNYYQFQGSHNWRVAGSGTTAGAITWLTPWQIAVTGHLLSPTDNTYDIGATGATRPRSIYVGTNGTFGGTVTVAAAGRYASAGFVIANIATVLAADGQFAYCTDCTIANPCAGGGTGALAKRLNSVNVCN